MRSISRSVIALAFFVPSFAHAVPLVDGFGGAAGYGAQSLSPNDDGSSARLDLTSAFPGGLRFFGGPYSAVFVNTNGNITFNGALPTYTPAAFPVATQPMIAPYWADVDIRGARDAHNNQVYWHFAPGMMVVTWHNVGYYQIHDDKRMDFQLILRNALQCGSGDFDVEFRFNRCEWTTGDASGGSGGFGGTPGQSGFDAGNRMDFVEIPGSRTMAIQRLCTDSNVGEAGVWRFGIRGGSVACPNAGELCQSSAMSGACGVGITKCVGGSIECQPIGQASAEVCDGVDNNCDGMIDEGDLCPAGSVCSSGQCVEPCFEGSCPTGYYCDDRGGCLESACQNVTCPLGQRCSGGACVGECDGVTCPHGRQCVTGHCIDLCSVITCGEGQVCEDGACVDTCPCRACASGETCLADGHCEQPGCDIVTCQGGFYCEAGQCLDACAGAVCPSGQVCQLGECTDSGGGGGGGGTGDSGTGDSGASTGDGGAPEDRPGGGAGTPGCGCQGTSAPGMASLLLVALVLRPRRKRR